MVLLLNFNIVCRRADIFRMFDDLVLLGTGGVPCYIGPSSYVINYFSALGYSCPQMENPAGNTYCNYTQWYNILLISFE